MCEGTSQWHGDGSCCRIRTRRGCCERSGDAGRAVTMCSLCEADPTKLMHVLDLQLPGRVKMVTGGRGDSGKAQPRSSR